MASLSDPYASLFRGTKIQDVNNIYNQPNPSGSGLFGPMTVNQAQNIYAPPSPIPTVPRSAVVSPTSPSPLASGYSPNASASATQSPTAATTPVSTPNVPSSPSGVPGAPTTPRPTTTGTDVFGNAGDWVTNPTTGINEFVKAGGMPSWYSRSPYDEFTKPVDETKIRDSVLSSQERIISAIRESAAAELARKNAELTETRDRQAGETRGLNIASGTAGSPLATTNAENVNKSYTKAYDAAKRESDAQAQSQISQLLGVANQHADNLIQAAKQEQMGAIGASQAYIDKIKGQASADVAKIAASGTIDLDRFKNSSAFAGYAQQTGMTPQELELYYVANSPKPSIEFHTVGQTLAAFEVKPDGTRTRRTDLDVQGITGAAAGDYDVKTDSNGNVIYVPKVPDPSKPNGGIITYNQPGSTYGDKPATDYQAAQLDISRARLNLAIDKLNTGDVNSKDTVGLAAADAQDVLEGRNTLFNIRQTMGRSQNAAAYMQNVRQLIRQADPRFDFVSSDAGGKFVSSTYYQQATAAINSVIPNIDKVVQLSDQVQRLGVKAVDNLLQQGQVQIGNQRVANFRQAQKLIADEIGLALGAGTVSDMKLQLGYDVTDPSVTPEVFASNMGVVKDFVDNRLKGLQAQRYNSPTTAGVNVQSDLDSDISDPSVQKTYTTREQLITALQQQYPEFTPQQIANRVYQLIPDRK